MSRFQGPVLLHKGHDLKGFDCGKEPLNAFLIRHALANQSNDSARTFVGLSGNRVIGYYSLAVSAVVYDDAPERMSKGLARHVVPVLLMARFAVDHAYQGQGIGRGLFKDALQRCLNVSKEAAARAFVVHAKDEEARTLYERYGMIRHSEESFHLYFLMKDVERALDLR